ncbi:hypothetical protein [Methanobrevibacter filiformis]|uniref:Uncharacterized protein n=1 Tax=Methanobrevibacter filiformis TaxID=55758 RepID=A0A166FFU0_9EURY|nr:hypothetical protein [Methanobrevibacter filiformis]KZX17632.1 hypothetical protein MBFIL_00190 [Methanobrevibacter filiformis]
MPPKPAIEMSIHRNEIIELLLNGASSRYVSDYLLNKYNEKISKTSINNYKKNHLNITGKATEKYIEKKSKEKSKKKIVNNAIKKEISAIEKIDETVNKVVTGIELLDAIIEDAMNITLNTNDLYSDERTKQLDIERHKLAIKNSAVNAVKVKSDILKSDEVNVSVNVKSKLESSQKILMQHEFVDLTRKLLESANNESKS